MSYPYSPPLADNDSVLLTQKEMESYLDTVCGELEQYESRYKRDRDLLQDLRRFDLDSLEKESSVAHESKYRSQTRAKKFEYPTDRDAILERELEEAQAYLEKDRRAQARDLKATHSRRPQSQPFQSPKQYQRLYPKQKSNQHQKVHHKRTSTVDWTSQGHPVRSSTMDSHRSKTVQGKYSDLSSDYDLTGTKKHRQPRANYDLTRAKAAKLPGPEVLIGAARSHTTVSRHRRHVSMLPKPVHFTFSNDDIRRHAAKGLAGTHEYKTLNSLSLISKFSGLSEVSLHLHNAHDIFHLMFYL